MSQLPVRKDPPREVAAVGLFDDHDDGALRIAMVRDKHRAKMCSYRLYDACYLTLALVCELTECSFVFGPSFST
jgi:hypothetical protein